MSIMFYYPHVQKIRYGKIRPGFNPKPLYFIKKIFKLVLLVP